MKSTIQRNLSVANDVARHLKQYTDKSIATKIYIKLLEAIKASTRVNISIDLMRKWLNENEDQIVDILNDAHRDISVKMQEEVCQLNGKMWVLLNMPDIEEEMCKKESELRKKVESLEEEYNLLKEYITKNANCAERRAAIAMNLFEQIAGRGNDRNRIIAAGYIVSAVMKGDNLSFADIPDNVIETIESMKKKNSKYRIFESTI